MRAILVTLLGIVHIARAEPAMTLRDVPDACRAFTRAPADPRAAWNQVLSLAGCTADNSTVTIIDPDDLPVALDTLASRLEPSLAIYVWAVQNAPDPIKIRAAYQIGLSEVALAVRARRSIVLPPNVTAERFAVLHARIEPMIANAIAVGAAAFSVIDDIAQRNPELIDDPVLRFVVADARRQLRDMPHPEGGELAQH
jgi:hypothetical protein